MAARSLIVLCMLCLYGCAVTVEEGTSGEHKTPPVCRLARCPPYKLLKKYEGFEYRRYGPTTWITTVVEDSKDIMCLLASSVNLLKYMNKHNKEGIKITKSFPTMVIDQEKTKTIHSKMLMYMPPEVGCPDPLDNTVTCENLPAASLYVKPFEGFAGPLNFTHHASALAHELMNLNKPFITTLFGRNSYNQPYDRSVQYNEVWFLAKEPPYD